VFKALDVAEKGVGQTARPCAAKRCNVAHNAALIRRQALCSAQDNDMMHAAANRTPVCVSPRRAALEIPANGDDRPDATLPAIIAKRSRLAHQPLSFFVCPRRET
jgi:hypothetical protein